MPAYQPLANVEPPVSDGEIRTAALQFGRKLSGTSRPSSVNEVAFDQAVDGVSAAAQRLLLALTTSAPRNRDEEARQAQERAHRRFA